jgi:DNA-binding LytR/AlgR family response regulator
MELRCIIVDDDEMARVSLQKFCEKIDELEVIAICKSAVQVIEVLEQEWADFILLDIEMPGLSGMDLVKTVTHLPYIIFTTSRTEYASQAFEFQERIVDFLGKPVSFPRLMKAIDRVREKMEQNHQQKITNDIFIKTDGRIVRIPVDDLLYIETVGDYVMFFTNDGKHMVHSTLKRIDEKLNHPQLLKVHRSYIINLSKVVDIEDNTIVINKKVIPVSRQYKPLLLRKIDPL